MKTLRILGGTHAGATLRLTRNEHLIGAGDDADIHLSDWTLEPMTLQLRPGQASLLRPTAGGAAGARVLKDLVPHRAGRVVLCIGPRSAAWPGDAALMAGLLRLEAASQRRWRSQGRGVAVGGLLASAGLMAALGAVGLQPAQPSEASAATSPRGFQAAPLAARLSQQLADAGLTGAEVQSHGRRVTVVGLLDNTAELTRLRHLLAGSGADLRVAAASDLAAAIAEALAEPGLSVRHLGGGHFAIDGQTHDRQRLDLAAQRLGADLAPHVRGIEVRAQQPAERRLAAGAAVLDSEGLGYLTDARGTRHLSGPGLLPLDPPAAR